MAMVPKPATSPWGRATDGLCANGAGRACFLAVPPVGRKNARRRSDRILGHCNSATWGSYYIAGRACDTAIFAALPAMAGFPVGPAQHMAKIIECASVAGSHGKHRRLRCLSLIVADQLTASAAAFLGLVCRAWYVLACSADSELSHALVRRNWRVAEVDQKNSKTGSRSRNSTRP